MAVFPKISIKFNSFLDPIFSFYVKNAPELANTNWKQWNTPTEETVIKQVKELKKEWQKYEKEIITALYEITEIKFKRNIIDVYMVSGTNRSYVNPIVMYATKRIEDFIDTLTHELIHVLIDDNFPNKMKILDPELEKIFPGQTYLTRIHILVFAIQTHIFLNVFKDENRIKNNMESAKKHRTDEYIKAWEIVNREGYLNIIQSLKEKFYKHKKPSN